MTHTQNGTHRVQLLGISPTVSPAARPVPSPNLDATEYPMQTPHTECQYAHREDLPSQSEQHRPTPRVFSTNGVKYPNEFAESPPKATRPATNIEPPMSGEPSDAAQSTEPAAPSGVRFALPESTSFSPSDQFPHVFHPSGEVVQPAATQPAATQPAPTSKLGSNSKTTHRHPFGALSSCCSTARPGTPPRTTHGHSHHPSGNDGSGSGSKSSHSHSSGTCCSESHLSSEDSLLKCPGEADDKSDIELGPPNFERTILRIDGLKCGCCEGGLSRAVSRIPAIKNYQVNVVLARVEFDLDTNRLSVADVIKLLRTRTGYNFEEQVTSEGQVLEFIITDPRRIEHASQPYGVVRIEAPTRAPWRPMQLLSGRREANNPRGASASTTARPEIRIPPTKIYYDANLIGARDVHQHYLKHDPDLRLAPLAAHPSLELGAKQTRRALTWFLPTLALTIPVIVLAWAPIDHTKAIHAHVSLALASIVQLIAFKEFVPSAVRSLYHSHVFEMDFLIAASTTIAYVFSVVSYAFRIRVSCFSVPERLPLTSFRVHH
jgi:copper chaperone CopZ